REAPGITRGRGVTTEALSRSGSASDSLIATGQAPSGQPQVDNPWPIMAEDKPAASPFHIRRPERHCHLQLQDSWPTRRRKVSGRNSRPTMTVSTATPIGYQSPA